MNDTGDLNAILLLCDAAQVVDGKLYILGGGWSRIVQIQPPLNMALAVRILIPWHEANKRHHFEARLINQDGVLVILPQGPVIIPGQIEVGRPVGLKAGASLDTSIAINVAIDLKPGTYRWDFLLNEHLAAQATFDVIDATRGPKG